MLAERIAAAQLAEMSAQSASLSASLRPADLPRLSAVVASGAGIPEDSLAVVVGFGLGPEGLSQVRIQAQGCLQLVCQRCLAPVRWPLDVDVRLTAVSGDAQANELADPFDSVLLEEGELLLRMVVEDEILAVLPLAPLHANPADCRGAGAGNARDEREARPNRPFAGLSALMGRGVGNKDQD